MKTIIGKSGMVLGLVLAAHSLLASATPLSISGLKRLEHEGGFRLEGNKVNGWGYMIFPPISSADMKITGSFRITQPAIAYSPPTPYWPLNYHYINEEPGYDFGIVVRTENSGVFYRIQFSSRWNEIALWKEGVPGTDPESPSLPSGFFAAVKTVNNIRLNREYAFSLTVAGNRLEFALDGVPILFYEDKVLPLMEGGWGIGVFNGAGVNVTGFDAVAATDSINIPPRKRPDFRVVKWHRGGSQTNVVFDGDEPIAVQSSGTAAWLSSVKLKPGYRPLLAWPFLYDNRHRCSAWKSLQVIDDTVVGTVVPTVQSARSFRGGSTMTLRYDAENDNYCYDIEMETTLKRDNNETGIIARNSIYFANIYPYNPMPTSDASVKINYNNWSTASSPYRMALIKLTDGGIYRWPIHHFYSSFVNTGYSGGSFWQYFGDRMTLHKQSCFTMYPERVVCTTLEMIDAGGAEPGSDYELVMDSCCQFWDMHFWYRPIRDGKKVTEFKTGETYRAKFRIFGRPVAVAERMRRESQLLPNLNPSIERPYYVNGINRFDQGGSVENTPGKLIWHGGGVWDKTFGRDDKYSLRFDGNGSSVVFIGYNGASAKGEQVRLSMWIRSEKPWNGSGVRFVVEGRGRFDGADRLYSDYVVPSEKEWLQVVYDYPHPTYFEVRVTVESSGNGKVWIDDLEYQILQK